MAESSEWPCLDSRCRSCAADVAAASAIARPQGKTRAQHPVETARIIEPASLDSLRSHVATTILQDLLFELYCYTKPRSWQKLVREL